MKRFVSAVLIFAALCSFTASAFTDVDPETNMGKAIIAMEQKGFVNGFLDNTFRPEQTLTRAEFVTIVNKMYGYTVKADTSFDDVPKDEWYSDAVLAAVNAGYIQGVGNNKFEPNKTVTREQVCVMMDRILKVELLPYSKTITDEVSEWARESVEKLISNRFFILEDGGRFRATEAITRGEVCEALEKCIVDVNIEIEPIDWQSLERDVLEEKLSSMIEIMNTKIIPECTSERGKTVARMVTESMQKYLDDPEYDYVEDAKATYEVYRWFEVEKAAEFKALIYDNIATEDIAILFDFFYTPEIDS